VRERKKQEARAEEEGRGVKSQIFGCHIVKNKGAQLAAINVGPTASEKRSPTCACLDMTGARPRDASILAGPEGLNRPRSITSNHLVHHNGQDASTPASSAPPTTPTSSTSPTITSTEQFESTTTLVKLKPPRASLQLIRGLGSYIRWMRSRAPTGKTKNED
jgi:hypothetical protein